MISLRSLKMKEAKGMFATKEDVKKARLDLEKKTEEAFNDYVHNKQNAKEYSHKKYLD